MAQRAFFAVLALALCVALVTAPAFAGDDEMESVRRDWEIPIDTDPALAALGVKATVATLKAEKPGSKETVLVFVAFDKAFSGEIQVRGFRADDRENARSALKRVAYKAREGGTIAFVFDKNTSFRLVKRFTLTGQAKAPVKKDGLDDFGDKISNTARELFQ